MSRNARTADDDQSVYAHGARLSGTDLGLLLAGTDASTVDGFDAVDYLRLAERKQNQDAAVFYAWVFDVAHREKFGSSRSFNPYADQEIAAALRISTVAAGKKIALAITIIETYPPLWQAMHDGRLDVLRAVIFDAELSGVNEHAGLRIVLKLLPKAPNLTPSELGRRIAAQVIIEDPDAVKQKNATGIRDRRVSLRRNSDGTMSLSGLNLPP